MESGCWESTGPLELMIIVRIDMDMDIDFETRNYSSMVPHHGRFADALNGTRLHSPDRKSTRLNSSHVD